METLTQTLMSTETLSDNSKHSKIEWDNPTTGEDPAILTTLKMMMKNSSSELRILKVIDPIYLSTIVRK